MSNKGKSIEASSSSSKSTKYEILVPEDISSVDILRFELHNNDGRLGKRLVETIINIQLLSTYGCKKIGMVPTLDNPEKLNPKKAFLILILKFKDEKQNPKKTDIAFNFYEKELMMMRKGFSFKRKFANREEGEDERDDEVPILIWKGNLYVLGFDNYDNQWVVFNDFGITTKRKIAHCEELPTGSSYHGSPPLDVGPLPLRMAIQSLLGRDKKTWDDALKVIAVHFIESARLSRLRDAIENAFTFDIEDEGWLVGSVRVDDIFDEFIARWSNLSGAYAMHYYGGGWDASKLIEKKLKITTVEEAESALGVCLYTEFSANEIEKHKKDFEAKKKEEKESKDKEGGDEAGEDEQKDGKTQSKEDEDGKRKGRGESSKKNESKKTTRGEHKKKNTKQKAVGLMEELNTTNLSFQEEMRKRKSERQFHGYAAANSVCQKTVDENDLSLKRLEGLHTKLLALQKEKSDHLKQVLDHLSTLDAFCAVLGLEFRDQVCDVNPTTISRLSNALHNSRETKIQTLLKLQGIASKMLELWSLMDTPSDEQHMYHNVTSKIAASEPDITESSCLSIDYINYAEAEVTRLENLKPSKMKELILKKKFELEGIWRQAHMIIDAQSLKHFSVEAIDSSAIDLSYMLEQMELQISNSKEEAFSRKDILEESWLEEYSRDECRYYSGRGGHLSLKRAEKARTVVNNIPATVEILDSKFQAWEKEREAEFFFDGLRLLSMLEDYSILRQEKEKERQGQIDQKKLQGRLVSEEAALFSSKPSLTRSVNCSVEAINSGAIDLSYMLEQMEPQISNTKEEAFSRKDILERVERWKAACEEESWLGEYSRDECRNYGGRGGHLNLKRAEKARTLVINVPGMVEILTSKIRGWEKERGAKFFYDGLRLISMLEGYSILWHIKEKERQRQRDQKKLQGRLLVAEKEALYGSKPSPTKSVKKAPRYSLTAAAAASRRYSVSGAMLQTQNFKLERAALHSHPIKRLAQFQDGGKENNTPSVQLHEKKAKTTRSKDFGSPKKHKPFIRDLATATAPNQYTRNAEYDDIFKALSAGSTSTSTTSKLKSDEKGSNGSTPEKLATLVESQPINAVHQIHFSLHSGFC